jgi:hypothetical protein
MLWALRPEELDLVRKREDGAAVIIGLVWIESCSLNGVRRLSEPATVKKRNHCTGFEAAFSNRIPMRHGHRSMLMSNVVLGHGDPSSSAIGPLPGGRNCRSTGNHNARPREIQLHVRRLFSDERTAYSKQG